MLILERGVSGMYFSLSDVVTLTPLTLQSIILLKIMFVLNFRPIPMDNSSMGGKCVSYLKISTYIFGTKSGWLSFGI